MSTRLEEIDRKLEALTLKLNTINQRGIKGHRSHIKKFYAKEILSLSEQKKALENLKEITVFISWQQVEFEDGQIRLFIGGILSQPVLLAESRSSFKHIRPFLLRLNTTGIEVSMLGDKILLIKNLSDVFSAVKILEFQQGLKYYFEFGKLENLSDAFTKANSLSNQEIKNLFKLNDRGAYLMHLSEIQDEHFKIIPCTEVWMNTNLNKAFEDTFIFTISQENNLYLVWESTISSRATYIFSTTQGEHTDDIQKLFNFIISEQTTKRSQLRASKKILNPLKVASVIEHQNTYQWKDALSRV